jgi:hypothetical protein
MKDIHINNININGYYITKDNPTVKVILEPQEELILSGMNIIELVLPKCKKIYCGGNFLTELIVPEGCDYVYCRYNNLIKLIIPKSCKRIMCNNNKLLKIIINLFQSKDPVKIALANNLQK